MSRTILVPLDRSNQSVRVLDFALEEFSDDRLILLHVIDLSDSSHMGVVGSGATYPDAVAYDRTVEDAVSFLDEYVDRAADDGADVEPTIERGDPARAIVEFADRNDVDRIVMGTHGRTGVSRVLRGSVAESVIRNVSIPVTIVR